MVIRMALPCVNHGTIETLKDLYTIPERGFKAVPQWGDGVSVVGAVAKTSSTYAKPIVEDRET